MELLQQLNRELNRTLIMVTHDPKTALYADLTLHLEKGQLIEALRGQAAASSDVEAAS